MPNEGIEPETKRKMVTAIMTKVDWSLWGALAILALYAMIRMATERSGPEGRGLGGLAAFLMIILLAGAAVGVRIAARRQSLTGLVTMAVIMAWPLVFLIADPLIRAKRARSYAVAESNVGNFTDATAAALARAIAQNDTATLTGLLKGQRPPAAKDQRGNDLLAYALVLVRENCEGLFSSRLTPREVNGSQETDTMLITRRGAERVCRAAFQLAQRRRRHVTLVDKANVLPSMAFFRNASSY